MNRAQRAKLAHETLEILERGAYATAGGRAIGLEKEIAACLAQTRYFDEAQAGELVRQIEPSAAGPRRATIEVVNETTLAGISRLSVQGSRRIAALNFASARHPGGGFLGGSLAQEESLATSSALYASLLRAPQFHETHRADPSLLYSHAMVASPDCPVFRHDDGSLMERPETATFITCAAPNAGAIARNQPDALPRIPQVLQARVACVLALAARQSCDALVLGAWGCGVFRNDPRVVAQAFRQHLGADSPWATRFERIVFAVLDSSARQETFSAFQEILAA